MSDRYIPAESGLPDYFTPMLRDEGRTAAFAEAIRAKVDAFRAAVGRAPRVVDLGAGSGLLSKLALELGAEHVTLVDVNEDMLGMASSALSAHGYREGQHFSVFHGSFTKMPYPVAIWSGAPFDMLVCEILGTLTTSESMHRYLPDALRFVRSFEGHGQFVIPSSATQRLSLCRLSVVEEDSAPRRYPHDNLIPDWKRDVRFVPTNELHLHNLHLKPFDVLSSATIRVDAFGCGGGPRVSVPEHANLLVPPDLDWNHFLVLEWTCTLSDGVELRNTLHGYKESPASGVDRAVAWGFLVAECGPLHDRRGGAARFSVRYPSGRKGWPRISLAS